MDWTHGVASYVALLVMFCSAVGQEQRLLSLGCYYCRSGEPVKRMLVDGWLQERLAPFVEAGVVDPLDDVVPLACFEKYSTDPADLLARSLERTLEDEGLYTGDVLVWQPAHLQKPVFDASCPRFG